MAVPAFAMTPPLCPSHDVRTFHEERMLSVTEREVEAAVQVGLDPMIPLRIGFMESRDNPHARNGQYLGLFQIAPRTAESLGIKDRESVMEIPKAVAYMKRLSMKKRSVACAWRHGEFSTVCPVVSHVHK